MGLNDISEHNPSWWARQPNPFDEPWDLAAPGVECRADALYAHVYEVARRGFRLRVLALNEEGAERAATRHAYLRGLGDFAWWQPAPARPRGII